MSDQAWLGRTMELFRPRERPPLGQWLEDNLRMMDGRPWSRAFYPHLHAPNGPIDAYVNRKVRTLWMQFGTRLGKTTLGYGALMYQAAVDPCPMLFGTATHDLVCRAAQQSWWPMLERCKAFEGQLPHRVRRGTQRLRLRNCTIYCVWSGSNSALADLSARVSHASEIDKWDSTVSTEADPLKLFDERTKEFMNHKRIKESTPTIKGQSRVERGIAGSTASRLWVPCPKCGAYQILEFGGRDTNFGIKWPEGHDADEAMESAYYLCRHCGKDIHSWQRHRMIRDGVWAPDGQVVNGSGGLDGEPYRCGSEWGFHLPSWYSLQLTWGSCAAEFLRSKGSQSGLKNWVNSWCAETWEEYNTATSEEDIAERLKTDARIGVVPDDAIFLTCGVDVQQTHLVYVVMAWGLEQRGYVVRWGTCSGFDHLKKTVLDVGYPNKSRTLVHRLPLMLIDSGFDTDEIYRFCRDNHNALHYVYPCKGGQHNQTDRPYKVQAHERSVIPLVIVNTNWWQQVIQKALDKLRPGDPGSISLPIEAASDRDFLAQLVNETPTTRIGEFGGNDKLLWVRRDLNTPNDFRDCVRYARCAAEMYVRDQWRRLTPEQRAVSTVPIGTALPTEPSPPRKAVRPASSTPSPGARPFVQSKISSGRGKPFIRRR